MKLPQPTTSLKETTNQIHNVGHPTEKMTWFLKCGAEGEGIRKAVNDF